MIVIGVDTHKRSHTLVALDAATGRDARTADDRRRATRGRLMRLRFAGELDDERVWAVEDCRHVSGRLERGLLASGDRVVRVAPGLTETSRRAVREPGKSDPIDATAIARAAIREGIDTLPVAFLDEQALEIRVLTDYRDQLITERVRHINRLRWHLVQIAPELEAQIRPAGLDGPRIRARLARQLGRLPHSPQLRIAKAMLKRINEIYREEQTLLAELNDADRGSLPAAARRARLRTGHRRDHHRSHRRRQRFPTDACFARHAGTAPIPASCGNTTTPPTTPRRRPPAQPRDPHHRALTRPHRPSHPRIPRPPTRRGQDQTRSNPLPQTPPRPPHLAAALHDSYCVPSSRGDGQHHHVG